MVLSNQIDGKAGVIDPSYRGEIHVMLYNFRNKAFIVDIHDKIAQLIIEKTEEVKIEEVTQLKLHEVKRGLEVLVLNIIR